MHYAINSAIAAMLALIAAPDFASAKGGSGHSGSHSHSQSHSHSNKAALGVKRDSHGHIERSEKAKSDFEKSHPCPSTGKTSGACPGYVVDHVTPLNRGGADHPSNLRWQTTEAAKIKDTTE